MPLIPPKRCPPMSAAPMLLVLFAPNMSVYLSVSSMWLNIPAASYRISPSFGVSRPAPAMALIIVPRLIPSRATRLRTVSSSPSSKPVIRAMSDFRSYTCTVLNISAGRFFDATFGSSEKNSFPSTRIFFIAFPLTVIFPSLSTSAPGKRFIRSSSIEFAGVLNDSALYSTVSLLTSTSFAFAVTTASSNSSFLGDIKILPRLFTCCEALIVKGR